MLKNVFLESKLYEQLLLYEQLQHGNEDDNERRTNRKVDVQLVAKVSTILDKLSIDKVKPKLRMLAHINIEHLAKPRHLLSEPN